MLEIYRKKDIEVLILDDEMDEIVFSGIDKYGDIDLKSVNKASTSDDLKDEAEPDKAEALKPLLEKLKTTLGDRVKDVRASVRLADSPSCIVSDEEEPTMRCSRCCAPWGRRTFPPSKPTLEINPDHEIVKKLLARPDDEVAKDAAWLLLDQALLLEGVPLEEPGGLRPAAQPHDEPVHLDSLSPLKSRIQACRIETFESRIGCVTLLFAACSARHLLFPHVWAPSGQEPTQTASGLNLMPLPKSVDHRDRQPQSQHRISVPGLPASTTRASMRPSTACSTRLDRQCGEIRRSQYARATARPRSAHA